MQNRACQPDESSSAMKACIFNCQTFLSMHKMLCLLFLIASMRGGAQHHVYVTVETNFGSMILQLSNRTPAHRDNFIKLVQQHYFDTTQFHRVVPAFVIQGGAPDSLFTTPDTAELMQQRLAAEFDSTLFHKRGALGMGRDANPLKASFFTQFYIVQGRTYTDAQLDSVEVKRLKGRKIRPERREVYKSIGGTPQLDGDYTIFGEVVEGLEVLDAISKVKTTNEAPLQSVWMKLRLLDTAASKELESQLENSDQ